MHPSVLLTDSSFQLVRDLNKIAILFGDPFNFNAIYGPLIKHFHYLKPTHRYLFPVLSERSSWRATTTLPLERLWRQQPWDVQASTPSFIESTRTTQLGEVTVAILDTQLLRCWLLSSSSSSRGSLLTLFSHYTLSANDHKHHNISSKWPSERRRKFSSATDGLRRRRSRWRHTVQYRGAMPQRVSELKLVGGIEKPWFLCVIHSECPSTSISVCACCCLVAAISTGTRSVLCMTTYSVRAPRRLTVWTTSTFQGERGGGDPY